MGGWGPEDPLEYLKEQREKRQKKKGQKGKKKNQQEQDQRSEEEASYHMSRFLSQEPHQEPWSHVSRGVWEK